MRVAFLSHAACVSTCECAWICIFVQICASSQSLSFLCPILSVLSSLSFPTMPCLKLPFKRKRKKIILFIYIGMHKHIREIMFCTSSPWRRSWSFEKLSVIVGWPCVCSSSLGVTSPRVGWHLVMSFMWCLTLFLSFHVNMIILLLSTPWGQSIHHSFVQFLSLFCLLSPITYGPISCYRLLHVSLLFCLPFLCAFTHSFILSCVLSFFLFILSLFLFRLFFFLSFVPFAMADEVECCQLWMFTSVLMCFDRKNAFIIYYYSIFVCAMYVISLTTCQHCVLCIWQPHIAVECTFMCNFAQCCHAIKILYANMHYSTSCAENALVSTLHYLLNFWHFRM